MDRYSYLKMKALAKTILRDEADNCKKDSQWLHAYRKFKTPPYYLKEKEEKKNQDDIRRTC